MSTAARGIGMTRVLGSRIPARNVSNSARSVIGRGPIIAMRIPRCSEPSSSATTASTKSSG